MNTEGLALQKRMVVLLAVLFCGIMAGATPFTAAAAALPAAGQQEVMPTAVPLTTALVLSEEPRGYAQGI